MSKLAWWTNYHNDSWRHRIHTDLGLWASRLLFSPNSSLLSLRTTPTIVSGKKHECTGDTYMCNKHNASKNLYWICVTSLIWLSETKWKPLMPQLGFWEKIKNHLLASNLFHQINLKTTQASSTRLSIYLILSEKIKIKCLPASWLIIAVFNKDLMLLFSLPKLIRVMSVCLKCLLASKTHSKTNKKVLSRKGWCSSFKLWNVYCCQID